MDRTRLSLVINDIVRQHVGQIRVCLPAKIVSYDADTHLAQVQPLIKVKPYKAKSIMLPVIANVPVIHPRTATAIIRLPIAIGDIVTLIFSDRSLEAWLQGAGEAKETNDTRQHHLSDAYAILGGYPKGKPRKAKNPAALEIEVDAGTRIGLGNGQDDVLRAAHSAFGSLKSLCGQVSSLLTGLQILTVTGVQGGSGTSGIPVNVATFASLKTTVDVLSSDVQGWIDNLGNLKT